MVTASWRALGTLIVVGVDNPDALTPARRAVAREVEALDLACSRFRDDSDLSRLNAAAGTPVRATPLLAEALRVALRAARLSEGRVDPTVGAAMAAIGYDGDFASLPLDSTEPPAAFVPAAGWELVQVGPEPSTVLVPNGVILDLGATAKALGSDRAAAAAHAACGAGVVVSLGGDVAAAGPAPSGGWTVHVSDDCADELSGPGQNVSLESGGLATSSSTVRNWRRGGTLLHHVVDPRTGAPAVSPYRTVSVAAATCVDANIATTATLVRGAEGGSWLESTGLPCRLVTTDGRTIHLNGWPTHAEKAA